MQSDKRSRTNSTIQECSTNKSHEFLLTHCFNQIRNGILTNVMKRGLFYLQALELGSQRTGSTESRMKKILRPPFVVKVWDQQPSFHRRWNMWKWGTWIQGRGRTFLQNHEKNCYHLNSTRYLKTIYMRSLSSAKETNLLFSENQSWGMLW